MSKQLLEKLVENNQLSHAYYLEGGAGEATAIWLATKILCCGNGEPCMTCTRILHHNHPDVMVVRPNGIAIKVDQIREIHGKAAFKSSEGKGQVFIISNADVMNLQAANAFLTFLEEPKAGVTIILTGTSRSSLIETIRSRVQIIELPERQGFMKEAVNKGLNFKSLGIFEELNISVAQAEEIADVADKWVDSIKHTFELTCNRALQSVQAWKEIYTDKTQRQYCIRLIQSYVKALFSTKKGAFQNWGNLPVYSWEELTVWGEAVDELTRAFHSNGQFNLHIERFIKKTMK